MTDAQIKHMVDRFLNWKLPENFNPDGGISFRPTFNEHTAHPMKSEPSGTNLFDATQAEAMVRYMLEGLPMTDATPRPSVRLRDQAEHDAVFPGETERVALMREAADTIDALVAALEALLERYDELIADTGAPNQEQAYYRLYRHAYDDWQAARAALAAAQEGE